MTDERAPKTCRSCGAVNPWMNETCRVCSAELAVEPAGSDESAASANSPPRTATPAAREGGAHAAWNPRWVLIGSALFALLFMGGEKLIEHLIVADDPELRTIIEEQLREQAAQGGGEGGKIGEAEKQRLRAALLANRALVVSGVLLFLLTPLLVGGVVGYFSGAIRNGAVACGLGTLAVMLLSTNEVLYGLVFGLVYAGLGALGALAGRHLRRRRSHSVPLA